MIAAIPVPRTGQTRRPADPPPAPAAATLRSTGHRKPEAFTMSIDLEQLGKYAGLVGAATAILGVAGILATAAYLSAWMVPAPIIRFDPLTAALRSDTVVFQSVTLWGIVFGLDALDRRLVARPWLRRAAIAATALALVAMTVTSVTNHYYGSAITLLGGVALLAAHRRGLVSPRATLLVFALIAMLAAFETGIESGRLIRDDQGFQTRLVVTTRTPIGGLDGTEVGSGWRYDDLYLVFRDGEAVYVARDGGRAVWVIPASNVASIGIVER